MANVKTDYVDYALKPVGSGNPVSLRKFETYNATTGALENTIYVKDVTDYATVGSNILASDLNTIGNAVNSNSTNFASEYSPSATYIVGAYCTYQNALYKCTTAITTPEALNSAHWTAVKSMDELRAGTTAKWADRFKSECDLLDITPGNPYAENNQTYFFGNHDATKFVNIPISLQNDFWGFRQVYCNKYPSPGHLTTVVITEQFPTSGRIWSNTYNTDTTSWVGWKKIEPVSI